MDWKKLTAIVATLAIAVGGTFAWHEWRTSVVSKQESQLAQSNGDDSTGRKHGGKTIKEPEATEQQQKTMLQNSITFEHALRDWGSDPTINPADLAEHDASEVLGRLRMPDSIGDRPQELNGLTIHDDAGPYAASFICKDKPDSDTCQANPTSYAWARNDVWGIGSRWIGDPTVEYAGGRKVKVSGTVKSMLATQGDSISYDGTWSAFTPAWKETTISDTLTFDPSYETIVNVKSGQENTWWLSPWTARWSNRNLIRSFDSETRVVLPLKGGLDFTGQNPTGLTKTLTCPVTEADMYETADWSYWQEQSRIPQGYAGS